MPANAPKGGLVSEVNGQFYEGGEFLPDTGLYCGKGKNRVEKSKVDAANAKAAAKGWRVAFNEATGNFEIYRSVTFTGGVVAEQKTFTARSFATLAKLI
jgi:hypothetical protein